MENINEETTVQEAGNEKKSKKSVGKTTGLRFISGFGFFLDKYRDEDNNKEKVKESMLEEFPEKKESIEKWLDWYKGYFNMGRIKGFEKSDPIVWKK